jgi:phage-related protein
MLMFSQGLSNLAVSGKEGAQALSDAIIIIIALIPLALTTLAKGIIDFAKTIGDGAPVIAESFMKIVDAIITAALNSIPKMVDSGMRLILGILTGISNNIAGVVGAGVNVIRGFIRGLSSMDKAVHDAMNGIVNGAVDGVKRLLGIHSPSTVFAEIGKYSALGFAVGLDNIQA